jgi:enamine deaminase RidA (YjgF/YER057c/UK114 family)
MSTIEQRLEKLGYFLPEVSAPAANYLPYTVSNNLVYLSGQLPMKDGAPSYIGKVGREFTIEQGQEVARWCGLNILAHLKNACDGDLDRVQKCIRLGVFVNAPDDFTDHPKVANGVSDMMVEIFGDRGRHARFAVGVSGLPFGVAVEADATFEIR